MSQRPWCKFMAADLLYYVSFVIKKGQEIKQYADVHLKEMSNDYDTYKQSRDTS